MWNPKRILLLIAGFGLFFAGYLVYARFLGGIDGLPPLPQAYLPGEQGGENTVLPQRQNNAETQLVKAFGEDCPEIKRSIRLEVAAHNLVLAAQDFTLEGGRVKLFPFSMAIFGKVKEGGWPEINSVRADVAYLEFDKKVTNIMEIGNRRIVGAELTSDPKKHQGERSGVTVVNNRGTAQRTDDVSIYTPGPILYQEATQHVWTEKVVRLTDLQSRPKPTTIDAIGMDVFLLSEAKAPAPAAPAPGKSRVAGVTGVHRIVLRSEVNMHLWIDARSGFLAGGSGTPRKEAVPKPAPETPAEKVQVVISTQGPFTYDLRNDRATFDIAKQPGPGQNQVAVHRINEAQGKHEQLLCEGLELQFQRRTAKEKPGKPLSQRGDDPAAELEIRSARAVTRLPGSRVAVVSESENLNAYGSELTYDAVERLTILKGGPEMIALKDGNEIHARELRMKMGEKSMSEVTAPGPGWIALLNRDRGERHQHARWQDELIASREGEVDVLLLTGRATFEDKQQGQTIQADRLKVWLEQPPRPAGRPAAEAVPEKDRTELPRLRPQRLEARGGVQAVSPDMRVRRADLLVLRFQDTAPLHGPPPFSTSREPVPGKLTSRPRVSEPPAKPAELPAVELPATLVPVAKPTPAKPRSPLDVTAETMEAVVLRTDARNELDRLICRGNVHVQQEPATADDKEVDIRGETLELTRHPEGNILLVLGKSAVVKFDKMTILGPDITINQRTNRAEVLGTGALTMPSDTSFDGAKLKQPALMTIYWNDKMVFDGRSANFDGGIQVVQEGSKLWCKNLQADMDPPVSFREGDRQKERPKVHRLICDQSVRIEDKVQENGRLVAHRKVSASELSLDNLDGRVIAYGPGVVRLLQYGGKGEVFPVAPVNPRSQPGAAPRPSAGGQELELKLTRIAYLGTMFGDNTNKAVTFSEQVEVVHLPAMDIDLAVNLDRLPPGAVYLQCQRLKVSSHRENSGKSLQTMDAAGKVIVRGNDFSGRADFVKFDEVKDQLILEAHEGNYASLYRQEVAGGEYKEIRGKKITYHRLTREHKVEGAVGVRSN